MAYAASIEIITLPTANPIPRIILFLSIVIPSTDFITPASSNITSLYVFKKSVPGQNCRPSLNIVSAEWVDVENATHTGKLIKTTPIKRII